MDEDLSVCSLVPKASPGRRWTQGRKLVLAIIVVVLLAGSLGIVGVRNYLRAQAALLNATTVSHLVKKWSDPLEDLAGSPIVVDGRVYASVGAFGFTNKNGYIYAFDALSGRQLWAFSVGPDQNVTISAVTGGTVYVESFTTLYALSETSGHELWSFQPDGDSMGSTFPTVASGVVYLGTTGGNNQFYALNASSGRVLWSFRTSDEERINSNFSPVVVGDIVYFSSFDGNFYALKATSGRMLWSFQVSGIAGVYGDPVVATDIVYINVGDFNSNNAVLYALKAAMGQKLWSFPVDTAPTVVSGIVYVGSIENADRFYALSATTGRVLWSLRTLGYVGTIPLVDDGVAYFSSLENSFYAVNTTTGQVLWTFQTDGYELDVPVITNGVVYIKTNMSTGATLLCAFSETTGKKLWSVQPGGFPTIANNMVYVWADDPWPDPNSSSHIYAFGLPATS